MTYDDYDLLLEPETPYWEQRETEADQRDWEREMEQDRRGRFEVKEQ